VAWKAYHVQPTKPSISSFSADPEFFIDARDSEQRNWVEIFSAHRIPVIPLNKSAFGVITIDSGAPSCMTECLGSYFRMALPRHLDQSSS
jgi:hypothetical protein